MYRYTISYFLFGIIGVLFFLLSITSFAYGMSIYCFSCDDLSLLEKVSKLGDFVAGPPIYFLSISGISAVFIAYTAQRHQIWLQKKELDNNVAFSKRQTFENNFYSMFDIYMDIIKSLVLDISVAIKPNTYVFSETEKDCFVKLFNPIFKDKYLYDIEKLFPLIKEKEKISNFDESYLEFLSDEGKILRNYFRHIYQILKHIHDSYEIENKKFYSNILRAQFTDQELLFLFFNSLSSIAYYNKRNVNFKSLIEEFSLFEHINLKDYFDFTYEITKDLMHFLFKLYDKKAFGDRYDELSNLLK